MGSGLGLRIGLMLDTRPMSGADFASLARDCEDFGFDLATLHPDHPSSSGVRGRGSVAGGMDSHDMGAGGHSHADRAP